MRLTARDLLRVPHVELRHGDMLKGRIITGVSTDSRTVVSGDLFVALLGPSFDGGRFIDQAAARGAVAAIVHREHRDAGNGQIPLLIVDDTTTALGTAARLYRTRFSLPVIAVAGSNGKTTTKEMIAGVLATRYRVLRTEGNLNNHVGVPQTLFRLDRRHEVAVIEIGSNHPGEVASLCRMVNPTHGVITMIGSEHLEFFGSLDGVADEEGALFRYLAAGRGTAFVQADDKRVGAQAKGVRNAVTVGFHAHRAWVRGRALALDDRGCARFTFLGGRMRVPAKIRLRVPGRQQASNALAAAAVGLKFQVPVGSIRTALESFQSPSKRMEVIEINGVVIYDDSYNANPDSMRAALDTLGAAVVPGKKIAVLGDMLELGERAREEHAALGTQVTSSGAGYLLTYGPLARAIHDAARVNFAAHYDQKNVLAEYLAELVTPGDAVLVKGSRGMAMEDIVIFLSERLRSAASR
jgi:UDP-N-acetylmuramoyl-tripeptide--D-alanyl-D-alanine ligase